MDPEPSIYHLVFVFLLVILNGCFVSAEYALVKVRSNRIETMAEEGSKRAAFASKILRNIDPYLSACQLGITLSSLALGWLGGPAIAQLFKPVFSFLGWGDTVVNGVSVAIAFILVTILHIVLGELAPKTFAIRKAESVTLLSAAPMTFFYKLMYPLIWVLNGLSNSLLRVFGITKATEQDSAHTEEELLLLMHESNKSGLIDNTELALVDNIFEFAETTAREIMIPRTEMICLYKHLSREENLEIANNGMRTRYPICDKDKDHIIGFVHIRDLLRTPLGSEVVIRPILAVPESIHISDLLKLMQRGKSQIAILIDEYGGTSGLVTLEDIMEEIVGEIQDEFDHERPGIEMVNEDEYSVDGLMLIDEINSHFGTHMEMDDYDTIGGWMYAHLDTIPPQVGQSIQCEDVLLIVEEVDQKRISRIKLMRTQPLIEEAGA